MAGSEIFITKSAVTGLRVTVFDFVLHHSNVTGKSLLLVEICIFGPSPKNCPTQPSPSPSPSPVPVPVPGLPPANFDLQNVFHVAIYRKKIQKINQITEQNTDTFFYQK